jgi:hypothetical protein
MFVEASRGRHIIHESQKSEGLRFDEIYQAVRGRFSWDIANKCWGVSYRPFRDYWILLLLTSNQRLFALQTPKVIPGEIVC